MTTLHVFDPALCCSSGVCGPEVDPSLVAFSADVDWLRKQGVIVERVNLAQQPQEFANQPAIRELLQAHGESALPVLLVDGTIRQRGAYPSRAQLAQWLGLERLGAIPVVAASGSCCAPAAAATGAPAGGAPAAKCC